MHFPISSCLSHRQVVRGALGMVTNDSRAFLGSSGGAAMRTRNARARRQAQVTLRPSLGLREGNCARRRLDSTTKEEGDWPSTGGEETD